MELMRKGVVTENWDKCFICGSGYMLETHHMCHGSYRKLADKYGLIVPLCRTCHMKLHDTGLNDKVLQAHAQEVFEREYPELNFLRLFGRNFK